MAAIAVQMTQSSAAIGTSSAAVTGYSAYWIGHIARRYNRDGLDGVRDQRHATHTSRPELPASQLAELGTPVAGPPPEATAGVDGPWLPGSANASDARSGVS